MLKRYKNKILLEIEKRGFNVRDFLTSEGVTNFVVYVSDTAAVTQAAVGKDISDEKAQRLAAIRSQNAAKARGMGNSQRRINGFTETNLELPAFVLSFRNTSLSFSFIEHADELHVFLYTHTKFTRKFTAIDIIGEYAPIEHVITIFDAWLDEHVRAAIEEELEPDLWASAYQLNNIFGTNVIETQDTSDFQEEERLMIDVALEKFSDLIEEEFKPDEVQSQQVKERLSYLTKATRRLNKIEWGGLVISTLSGIMINLTIDTEKGRFLYELFLRALDSAKHLLK